MSDYESSILQELTSIGQATGSAVPVDPVAGNEQIAAAPSPDDYEASIFKELSGLNPGAVAPTPKKQVDIAPDVLSSLVIAAQRGAAGRDLEKDLTTLEDADLVKIYGQGTDALRDQMYNELKAQQKTLEADRGVAQIMGDSINKGAQGAIGFIGGGLSLAAGAGNYVGSKINDGLGIEDNVTTNFADQVAPVISEATNAAVGWLNGFTSDQTQETDRLVALQTNYETGVNKAERDAAVAAGGNSVVETMRMVGKDFLDGGAEILDNPTATSNLIAGALGSLGPSAKVVGSVAKMIESTGTYKAAQLAAAIDITGMGKILGLAANATKAGATAGAVGLTEAAGTYQQTMQEVLDMPEEDLLRSAEYFHLVENGMDPGKARTQVAERTAREAFFTALPLATATSIMALKFDANPLKAMGNAGFQDGLAGIGREVLGQTVEEALQGGSSEYSRNLAFQDNINPAQELFTGVGEQAAAGAIGGAGMAGVLGIPGAAGAMGNLAAGNLAGPAGSNPPSAPTPFGPNDPNSPSDLDPGMSTALLDKAQSDIAKMEAQTGPLTEYQQEVLRVLRSNQDNPDNLYKLYVPNDRSPAAEKAFNESLNDITPSALSTFVETAKVKAGQAAAAAKDLYSKASAGAAEGFAKAKETVAEKANEYNNKQTPEASAATVQAATNSVVAVYDWNTQTGQDAPEGIKQATAPKAEDIPTELQDTLSSAPDVVSTVSSLVQNLTTGAIKVKDLSNDGLLYAHDHIEKLRAALPTMPKDVQESVKAMLNSPSVAKIQARMKGLDLSTKVGNSVSALKRMVRVNPTKVNPTEVAKILEQRDRTDLTDEDVRLLSSAAKISSALDNHAGNKVQIGKDEIVDFTKPVNAPILDNQNARVSRNLQVEGFNGLRSINDYASDIFRAAQSSDPTAAVGLDGNIYSGTVLSGEYGNFTQHLINKVDALNQSHDAGGKFIQYESLNAKSRKMVPAGQAGGAKAVAYHAGNLGSIKNAQAIYNDAKAAVEVYNILVETFPEMFPDGKKTLPVLKITPAKEDYAPAKPKANTEGVQIQGLDAVIANGIGTITVTENGVVVPFNKFALSVDGKTAEVGFVERDKSARAGIGYDAYVALGIALAERGITLQSTTTLQEDGRNLWRKLVKNGFAQSNPNTKRFEFVNKTAKAEAEPKPAQPEAKPKVEATAEGEAGQTNEQSTSPKVEERKATAEETDQILDLFKKAYGDLKFPKLPIIITDVIDGKENRLGQMGHNGTMKLVPAVFENKDNMKKATHIVFHELGHWVDKYGEYPVSDSRDWAKAVAEFDAFVDNVANETQKRFLSYILSHRGKDTYGSEVFADLFSIMGTRPDFVSKNFPLAQKLMTEALNEATGNPAKPNENQDEQTVSPDTTEDVSTRVETPEVAERNSLFTKVFSEAKEPAQFNSVDDIVAQVNELGEHMGVFTGFLKANVDAIQKRLNARLSSIKFDDKKSDSVIEALRKDPEKVLLYRDFKNLAFVDSTTGLYDPTIASLAISLVLDELSGAHPAAPSLLLDRMAEDGVSFDSITEQQLKDYMQSISIRQIAENLARDLPAVLGLQINDEARLGDASGALEDLIKEILVSVAETNDGGLLRIADVPTSKGITQAIVLSETMKDLQISMGLDGRAGMSQLLFPENISGPSLNAPPEFVAQKQTRGGIETSTAEREVLKNMQSIGHSRTHVADLLKALGPDVMFTLLGGKDVSHLADNHPLRRSIEGKNLSIERDYQDALEIAQALEDAGVDSKVYYPVGISRVGRHQMQGPNPQNNKILRHSVTSTVSVLDMRNNPTHQDYFWLTVAQAAGMAKAEKKDHDLILSTIEGDFRGRYRDAIYLAREFLITGEIDAVAFDLAIRGINGIPENSIVPAGTKIVGYEATMAVIDAVMAVAALDEARADGTENEFTTTLSFEIDGLTDGPGNMLVNMGQGLLTLNDYENLRRVGYFLGERDMTTNAYYGQQGNKDFYEMTTQFAEASMALDKSGDFQMQALARFAARFGDFEIKTGPDGRMAYKMTRNTAKSPVTKKGYGSGVGGIARGIAEDMVLEFYRYMTEDSNGNPAEERNYPEFVEDFLLLFSSEFIEGTPWDRSFFDKGSVVRFTTMVENTLGRILTESAEKMFGSEIQKVNDTLIFMTNIQATYLQKAFEHRVRAILEARGADPKKPIRYQDLTVGELKQIVSDLKALAPVYYNGVQSLGLGAFEGVISENTELSSTMDGRLRMKSTLPLPSDAGVKVIPYLNIGRGDAMMMNVVYGNENFPTRSIPIFDGVSLAIADIGAYSDLINEAVAENWNQDLLEPVFRDLMRFSQSVPANEQHLLQAAYREVAKMQPKSIKFKSLENVAETLAGMVKANQARKAVFDKIPRSVNHMAGADRPINLGPEGFLDLDQINNLIAAEMRNPTPKAEEEPADPKNQFTNLSVMTGMEMLRALLTTVKNPRLLEVLKTLVKANPNVRVVTGNAAQIAAHRLNEGADPVLTTRKGSGFFDEKNQTIYLVSKNHETLVHELIHFTTFALVHKTYAGQGSPAQREAVTRLEKLMGQFMEMDFSKASKAAQRAAKSAKAQILGHQANNDAWSQAAALNEFMAWSLANEALRRELGNTLADGVLRFIKAVKALMARLLGSVSYDMFSNVLFNTRAILEPDLNQEPSAVDPKTNEPTPTAPVEEALTGEVLVDEDAEGDIFGQGGMMVPYGDDGDFGNGGNLIGGNGGSGGNGGNGSSQDPSGMPHYNNFWINLLRTKLNELRPAAVGRTAKTDQFIRYLNNARKAYDRMVQGGFGFTEEQRLTFEAIHMILALEVQLDARALQSMGKVFNHVVENLRPEMFTGEAQDKYQSFMDALGKTTNDEQVSDAIATFFAMSQTNDEFRFVLEQLPKPADKKASSFSEFVSMMSISMMRKAVGSINPDDKNARDAMDMLSRVILAQDTKEEFRILRLLMKSFDVADQYTSGKLRQMSDMVSDYAYNVPDEQRMKKKIAESVALVTNLFSDQRAELTFEFVKTITHNGNTFDDFVFLRELVAEMIGTDKNNEKIVALMDVVKKQVSALREGHRDNVPLTLQGNFQTKPTAEQWAVAHAVLAKTDFSALFDLQYADQTMSLVSDPAYRARQIKIYSDTIKRELSRTAALAVMDKAQQLADFMNGNGAGFQLMRNAFAINEIEGDKSKPGLVTAIDKLVSLLALDGKDPADLQTISDMYAADPDAMKSVLVYMKKLNQNEDEKLQVSETILTDEYGDEYDYDPVHRMRMNGYKGYVPNLGNPDVTITVEDDAYRTILEKRGFIRVGDYTADDMVSVFSKGYYVSSTRQNGGYAQGVMQSIQNTYRGVNAGTGITVNGTTSGIIMGYENLDRVISTLNRAGTVADPKETLLPVYDGDSVIYYERALNPDLVEKYTQPDGNLALQLGVWSGRQVEEKAAQSYNALLIDQLKAVWDNREQGSDGLFIDIRAEYYAWMQWERATKEERRTMRKPDAIYADSWKVIPPQTKAYIAGVFGDDGFMVRRDQVNTALGYAEPSISDFWTGKTRFSEETASVVRAVANMTLGRLKSGTSALTILQTAAGGLQETVSFAKDLIVTRSLVVPYLNSQANIFTLNLRGVPNKMIVTGYRDKLIEIEQYNQNFKKIMFLNTQYDLAEGDTNKQGIIRREIQVLKDQNRRMSIHPLVEAGVYKNISEGITEEDFDILKTGLASLVEKQVDRLPDIAKTIVRNGLVSQTTDIYRVANKAVQYGDFLAKGVYFDYLTQIQGMKPEEALSRINEEYVNFSTPPGRVRSALDKYGATWFMTYKIRVAKIAMAQARQNPVRALLVNTLDEGGRNTAQHSNLFANMLDGSIEYSLGWEMMMNSPGLNPWLNMVGW